MLIWKLKLKYPYIFYSKLQKYSYVCCKEIRKAKGAGAIEII